MTQSGRCFGRKITALENEVADLDAIAIQFMHAVPNQDELPVCATLFFEPSDSKVLPKSLDEVQRELADAWQTVQLPNGESIEAYVTITNDRDSFSMFIKQDGHAIAQLLCNGRPFFTFRTDSRELFALQVFDRAELESTIEKDSK